MLRADMLCVVQISLMMLPRQVKQVLASIFWLFASVLLWTPANLKIKFLSSHSKWVYFRFQSMLVHSQVAIITGVFVPFNFAFVGILYYANHGFDFLVYAGIAYALWCLLIVIASVAVKKFFPDKSYLFQYIFLFLAFAASFEELSGVLYTNHLDIFETQLYIALFYMLMVITLFFQWSTLLTFILLSFFGVSFLTNAIGFLARNQSEVSVWMQC